MKIYYKIIVFLLFVFLLIPNLTAFSAEKFPSRPISFIIPATPGSGADILARQLSLVVEKHIGQPLVVVNKPGGSGIVAMSYLLEQPADGYNLFVPTRSIPIVLNMSKKVNFSHKDFEYIMCLNGDYFLVAVNADSPFKTIEDFINHARKNPGVLKVGGTYVGSTHYLVYSMFAKAANIKTSWVPFESSGDSVVAATGGHVDAAFANPVTVIPKVDAKKLRILASTSEKRILPDVPTLKEKGYNIVEVQWRGLMAKKGTSPEIIEKLHQAFKKGIEEPKFKDYLDSSKLDKYYLTPKEFTALVDKEMEITKVELKEAGVIK